MIPREFPASQTNSKKRRASTKDVPLPSAKNAKTSGGKNNKNKKNNNVNGGDALDSMIGEMGYADLVSNDSLDDLGQFDFDFSEG